MEMIEDTTALDEIEYGTPDKRRLKRQRRAYEEEERGEKENERSNSSYYAGTR